MRAEKAEPLKIELKNFTLSDKVQFRIEEIEKGKTFKLFFTGKTGLVGRYKGVLNLTTNYPEKPIISLPVGISVKKRNN